MNQPGSRTLSIIIPAYNESGTIRETLNRVKASDIGDITKEIIVVDDCSKDNTREILRCISDINVVEHSKNRGKGGAVKTGIASSSGDFVIIQDADLEYDPQDFRKVLAPAISGKTKIVLGVRQGPIYDPRITKASYWFQWFGNHMITFLTNILYANHAGEYEGCYKLFSSELLKKIEIKTDDFDFDNELVCRLLKLGCRTVDVPINYNPRSYKEGKKIGWKHGLKIIWTIIKIRLFD